ncbi:MAG: tetratricopeptide repeat protein [Mangrovibacterium sp.]
MITKKKQWFLCLGLLLMLLSPLLVPAQQLLPDTDKLQLANRYYQSRTYDKAAVLYRELYETTGSQYYFEVYLTCLIENGDFETAEKEIKRELRRTGQDASLYVQWAFLLKRQNRVEEGDAMLDRAIQSVMPNKTDYLRLGNSMIGRGEYPFAEKLYRDGSRKLPGENFHYELGRIYLYQRDYVKMFDEYLQMVREDETALVRVESSLQAAFRMDVDQSLQGLLRTHLLKRMQKEPDVLAYNRVLIWLFLQEQDFSNALRQQLALDLRTGQEERQLLELARVAGRNGAFSQALQAYDYLIAKGEKAASYKNAWLERMNLLYLQFTTSKLADESPERVESQFEQTLNLLGYSAATYQLIRNYGHLLAFYSAKPEQAISLLKKGMELPGLSPVQQDELKAELADIQVYSGDMWEAVLLYSQVIENNKTKELGDEAKLKKAKLAYYMGDLKWAKAQLDVIKASTSKLVANDALELSLFIGNNINLDTTMVPVSRFARADLFSFRNEKEKAWAVLDSIETDFPYHSLIDDIYFRKANLLAANGDYVQAAEYLEKIVSNYPFDLLGDDAMYQLAGIYQQQLGQPDKARELYKNILSQYPGSIYVSEARKKYRELRGDFSEDKETEVFNERDIN